MNNNINKIGFVLNKISTEQFAMLDMDIDKKKEIGIGTQIGFGVDEKNKVFITLALFKFQQDNNTFLIIEVACHFKIADSTWDKVLDKESRVITFPKNFVSHLLVLTIGSTRGVLHAKTENTKFNEFILPTINVNDLITSDIALDLSKFSEDKEKV